MPTPPHHTLPRAQHRPFTSVSMGLDGTIYAADNFSAQRHIGDGNFRADGDRAIGKISVGSQTEIWGIDSTGQPARLQVGPPANVWRNMGTARLTSIDCATDGTVCGLDQNSAPVRWNGSNWEAMGGGPVAHISVSSRYSVWGIDGNGIVQQWDPPRGDRRDFIRPARWLPLPPLPEYDRAPQPAISIAVGSDGVIWVVGASELVYQFKSDAWIETKWGPVSQIAGGDSYNLVGLTPADPDNRDNPDNEVWFSGFGPLRVPMRTAPPGPPPVATFSRWWGVSGMPLSSAPALAAYNHKAYFASKDNDSRGWLWLGTLKRSSQPEWEPGTQTGPGSPGFPLGSTPALAAFKGSLFCAFQARDAGHALCVARSFDGDTFFPPVSIPGNQAGATPALAAFNGRLYCAYQANDARHILYVTSSSDGENWVSPARGYDGIIIGGAPTLAAFKGRLYCAFQADDSSNTLFVTSSGDGENWVSPARGYSDFRVGSAPALAAFKNRLYCAYQANDANQRLCVITSVDGQTWEQPFTPDEVGLPLAAAPALCALEHALYVGFCSNTGGLRMFYASAA